ncbi:MAG: cbb3-type cytochrome oxidase assembly protein CcoS [Proteobacteria bacterium]|nr:cbb3-type cytochrome oxidase assembly protein CcoS [Pseudomonadota bacterium]MDA1308397.1 cbb3-type cytochrome oxidase assembly protein CcoS [Pseudomonadota bacterium]
MSVLLILIPAALGLGLLGLIAFLWTLRSGQYDDLEGASHRILIDDEAGAAPPENELVDLASQKQRTITEQK